MIRVQFPEDIIKRLTELLLGKKSLYDCGLHCMANSQLYVDTWPLHLCPHFKSMVCSYDNLRAHRKAVC